MQACSVSHQHHAWCLWRSQSHPRSWRYCRGEKCNSSIPAKQKTPVSSSHQSDVPLAATFPRGNVNESFQYKAAVRTSWKLHQIHSLNIPFFFLFYFFTSMKWRHCVFFREGNYLLKMACQHHEFYMTEAPSHNIFKLLLVSPQSSNPSARRCGTSHQESWHRVWLILFTGLSLPPADQPWNTACPEALPWRRQICCLSSCLQCVPLKYPPRRLFGTHRCEQRSARSCRASYLLQGLWRSQISKPRQEQC